MSGGWLYSRLPFTNELALTSPSAIFAGKNGRVFIIDDGKKNVLVLNSEKEVEISASDNGFHYVSLVVEGPDGSIYIADTLNSGIGTFLSAKRIFRCDAEGSNLEVLVDLIYDDIQNPSMQCCALPWFL
ncbi:MAG: hypothetical protein LBR98_04380 [Syntrophomonadaceae bacterium]|jgi:hypothetical protein|nr:hypothetical protein [Syntrophomonadaceae bacterium]